MVNHYTKQKEFLLELGIRPNFIFEFLNYLSYDELEEDNRMIFFSKYLKFYDNGLHNEQYDTYRSLRTEKYIFESFGFHCTIAYEYVGKIKDIYFEDTTINWIYRIVDSKVNDKKDYEEFVEKCNNKNELKVQIEQ